MILLQAKLEEVVPQEKNTRQLHTEEPHAKMTQSPAVSFAKTPLGDMLVFEHEAGRSCPSADAYTGDTKSCCIVLLSCNICPGQKAKLHCILCTQHCKLVKQEGSQQVKTSFMGSELQRL